MDPVYTGIGAMASGKERRQAIERRGHCGSAREQAFGQGLILDRKVHAAGRREVPCAIHHRELNPAGAVRQGHGVQLPQDTIHHGLSN